MKTIDNITIAADAGELLTEFARIFVHALDSAIAESGTFCVALSGGSTPRLLYSHLAKQDIAWEQVRFFFGDERMVSPDDAESNFGMASETLFGPAGISEENIFRWRTELDDPEAAAGDYERKLSEYFAGHPRFDLCLLGLGADSHTASLFPGTQALTASDRMAIANWVPKFRAFRLTLTPRTMNGSKEILFVATGREKAEAVAAVTQGAHDPFVHPAQLIAPKDGRLRWLIDADAASGIAI